jgi:hypothetical protein
MRNLIKNNLNGKKIIILFILTNIVYAFMLLVTIPKVMSFSGGMKLPDMMPTGYDADYLNLLFTTLGEKGRDAYLFNQIPADMIYPFLFGISYCLILAYILNKLGKFDSYLFYFCLIPLLAGLFDYCENAGIILMLSGYPKDIETLAGVTNVFSVLKGTLTTIYFISLIFFLVNLGFKKLKNKII